MSTCYKSHKQSSKCCSCKHEQPRPNYAISCIYTDGDNGTYLHSTLKSAMEEKEQIVKDLKEFHKEEGQRPIIIEDTPLQSTIAYVNEEGLLETAVIVISTIYE